MSSSACTGDGLFDQAANSLVNHPLLVFPVLQHRAQAGLGYLGSQLGRTEAAVRKRWQRGFLSPDRTTLAERLGTARDLGIGLQLSAEDIAELSTRTAEPWS